MPEGGPSIRDAISSAMTSAGSGGSPADSAGSASGPSSAPAPAAAPSGTDQVTPSTIGGTEIPTGQDTGNAGKGPVRASDGKFAPKGPTDPAQQAPAALPAKSPDPAAKPEDASASAPPILMPSGWGKENAEVWKALPRNLQEVVEKREKDRDRALHQERNKLQVQLKNFDALGQVIQPRAREMAMGGGPAAYIGRLLALNDAANENPLGFAHWFLKQNGIDPASLAAGSQQTAPVDPNVKALQDQIARQNRVITELGNRFQGTAQARETEAQTAMLQTIDRWAGETEQDGTLKRPYFERLEPQILALLPIVQQEMPTASPTERLEAAYDRAVYAHPETRSAVQQMAEAKRVAEDNAKRAKAVEAAKLAGTSIGGSTAPNAGSVPLKSVGAELRRVRDQLKGRAA